MSESILLLIPSLEHEKKVNSSSDKYLTIYKSNNRTLNIKLSVFHLFVSHFWVFMNKND